MTTAAQDFLRWASEKAFDLKHRRILRKNLDHWDHSLLKVLPRYNDYEVARNRSAKIKHEALENLDEYLLQFESRIKSRGGHVFWAESAEEARRYVSEIARKNDVKRIVKSKSMVTEEIHLTPALEELGCEVFETDLGEFIVQLRKEPPYHIVAPAMHLSRVEIAELFREKLGGIESDDPKGLVEAARRKLREAFFTAEMGITGANFLVADAGLVAITTNEGNGRLGTSLPRIHVAVTGIEKIVPRLADLAVLWPTLTASATGRMLAAYKTLIGGPRQPGEVDGPEEFHVVLLDNGRSELLADTEQRDVLRCIRCGACSNVCPVYQNIGGHAYGTTYQGPIGSVLTPHFRGPEFDHLSYASSLCGRCTSVCPVRIDLHHHLLHNRRNTVKRHEGSFGERLAFRGWRWTMMGGARFSLFARLGRSAIRVLTSMGANPLKKWTAYRAAPELPKKSFREMWRDGDA
jgi:L-lactate dehydrogenase complex protein LldF